MSVNFSKNQEEIIAAWRTVTESKDEPKWAIFGYEGSTNVIKLMSSGSNGLNELLEQLNCSLIQYAFCRIVYKELGLNKLILINWQGESAPSSRKGVCASHLGDVADYFKGCSQTITIRNDDEATEEHLLEKLTKGGTAKQLSLTLNNIVGQQERQSAKSKLENNSNKHFNNDEASAQVLGEQKGNVSSNSSSVYRAEVASIIVSDRKTFWEKQQEEEKSWAREEQRKLIEKQQQYERETKERIAMEAKKLAATIEARDKAIDAARLAERNSLAGGATCFNCNPSIVSSGSGTSSGNQPMSIVTLSESAASYCKDKNYAASTATATATATDDDDDDDESRVGRRSELIRLERNQETHALIGKGLIKNKRAIFEQKVAEEQSNQEHNRQMLPRRSSGPIVTRKIANVFKSLQTSSQTKQQTLETTSNTNSILSAAAAAPSSSSSSNSTTAPIDVGAQNNQLLANGFADKLTISACAIESKKNGIPKTLTVSATTSGSGLINRIKKEVESVKLTKDENDLGTESVQRPIELNNQLFNGKDDKLNEAIEAPQVELLEEKKKKMDEEVEEEDSLPKMRNNNITSSPKISSPQPQPTLQPQPQPEKRATLTQDMNGNDDNSEHQSPAKQQQQLEIQQQPQLEQQQQGGNLTIANTTNNAAAAADDDDDDEPLPLNGEFSAAIALFDYEAADNTEISFDPEDKIGFIQKVDPGWWQGKVLSGRFKGQMGLFPSNYVKEV